ncbi:CAP2 [Candida pseudojiufengensis]|uniref:CAP2 n=1 Tax=Candida pseudojiufengensis TaxID=497109 RepID=UPI002224F37D|nr:CAP2 [Candida pseudojiufengensis]KAI5965776.1 CAP2 [Candida pseudojiufengensis]
MSESKFDASLNLLRRLDPQLINENLTNICSILQSSKIDEDTEIVEDLLSSVDIPLSIQKCQKTGKDYLCCDYNRDGDSYRSPWSNEYYPKDQEDEEDQPFPSPNLRQLEIKANDAFDIYRDLYYEGSGLSSVYFWDTSEEDDDAIDEGFAGVILFKKQTNDKLGKWDSIHVLEVIKESSKKYNYKLTTSVILDLSSTKPKLNLSGNLTRQFENSISIDVSSGVNLETNHLINIGQIIEKSEYNIRNILQEVYFDKLKDIMLKDLRIIDNSSSKYNENQKDIIKGLKNL